VDEWFERMKAEIEAEPVNRADQRIGADLFAAADLPTALQRREADEHAFLTLALCGAEIDNGGFAQLFTNSTGELIDEAITGAEHLGVTEHAAILRESKLIFPSGIVPRADDLERRLDAFARAYLDESPAAP
jgi:Domain of unknown function (DUF4375)